MQNSVSEGENTLHTGDVSNNYNAEATAFSYDDVFPALSTPSATQAPLPQAYARKFRVGTTSTITKVFSISAQERKSDNSDKFGESDGFSNVSKDIMKQTNTTIEFSSGKDQTLTFLVSGKPADVAEARKRIVANFQTPVEAKIDIPKEFHRKFLGKSGQKLKDLEKKTSCTISVPNINQTSDTITISGLRNDVDQALHEIKSTYDQLSKQATDRIQVPKMYYPFISGPSNENLLKLQNELQVKINIPPPSAPSDEIIISGTKEGIQKAIEEILAIYHEMEAKCKQVSVEVPKMQHRYIIGPRGATIAEIFQTTGVAVEMPPSDDATETITLRGPQEKLGHALTMVCAKAISIKVENVEAPGWLHKRLRGKKGANIRRIVGEDSRIHVEFKDDTIKIEGPAEEVKRVKEEFEKEVQEHLSSLAYDEIVLNPDHVKHIIGKSGANVNRLKEKTGVEINILNDGTFMQLEGTPEGVKQVKAEIAELISKLENEREVAVNLDLRLIRSFGCLKTLRETYPLVNFSLPPPGEKGQVRLRGPGDQVDACLEEMKKLARELAEQNSTDNVPISKQYHRHIIGKEGSNIRRIREETETKIDIPNEDDSSNLISITGRPEDVRKAKELIKKIEEEVKNVVTAEIHIPAKMHNMLIGSGGRHISNIQKECNVQIKFPPAESNSDVVTIRGAQEDVDRAVSLLDEQRSDREASNFSASIKAKPEYHKFLIGKQGSTVRKIRYTTGARIVFPSESDVDQETITIFGKEEQVAAARQELEQLIHSLENTVQEEMTVPQEYHAAFVAKRGAKINQISADCGGVVISFPRSNTQSDKVTIKGSKEFIDLAKQKINEIIDEVKSEVKVELNIPSKYHRSILGTGGRNVKAIIADYDVQIKFPARQNGNPAEVNGGDVESPDTITIRGQPENCEKAKEALLALQPVTIQVSIPAEMHRSVIGVKGETINKIKEEFDVSIIVPPSEDHSDEISVTGLPECVERAKQALLDVQLKNFQVTLEIDPEFHRTIIGRKGESIRSIRDKFDVNVNIPKDSSVITITGYEDRAIAAREHILSLVNQLKSFAKEEVEIDSRVHARIIGQRGRSIKRIVEFYKVDVKFAKATDPNPNLVVITGEDEDAVLDAKEDILAQAESLLEDTNSTYKWSSPQNEAQENDDGFHVSGGPWETGSQKTPNTSSTTDFPSFGLGNQDSQEASVTSWGPRR